jgi:hypothetical protein
MALKIERGIKAGATRGVLYGTEGIGKSTLAAQWPSPVILDTEDGTGRIDCARVRCGDWMTLYGALVDLTGDPQGFATVVLDSIDWAERSLLEHMLRKDGKKSVEDYGFGKGYTKLAEQFSTLLGLCDQLVDKGVHVVLVGHSTVKRTTPPDMDEGWDRYELKLTKQVGPLVKEWSDLLLFANYRTRLVEGSDGRTRAKGGKERVLFTERSAAFDAKNRFGLAPELPMTIEALAPIFAGPKPVAKPPVADAFEMARSFIAAAKTVKTLGRAGDRIDELSSDGQLTEVEVAELMGLINARHQEIEPAPQEAAT